MNQQVTEYVSTGIRGSDAVLNKRNKEAYKYFVFTMASIIGKLFFLSYPLFALAEYHIVNQIKEKNIVTLEVAFEDSNSTKKYWTTVHFALINTIILVLGILFIAVIAFGLIQLGFAADTYFNFPRYYSVFIFQILSGCLLLAFLIQKGLYFGPVVYLIQSSGIGLSEALQQSNLMMTKNGKTTLLQIHAYYFIRLLFYTVIGISLSYGAFLIVPIPWFILFTIILSFLLLKSIPEFLLAHKISTSKLFADLIIDLGYATLAENRENKTFIDKVDKEDILMALFDEIALDESVPETTESTEAVELTETTESTESVEATEITEPTEATEATEATESVASVDFDQENDETEVK